jgi:hypothetical protein
VKSHIRGLVLLSSLLAVVLLGGAGRSVASTKTECNQPSPTGRQFCITVTDTDGVSPSGPVGTGVRHEDVTAYQYYQYQIQNVAGSTLTNGTMSVVLTDNFINPASSANSTAVFVPSASSSSCTVVSTSPNRVDCVLGNLAANTSTAVITLAYRTSNSPGVDSTTAAATVAFKEGTNPNGANPSSYTITENTSLEPDPESSHSYSPPNQTTDLGTSPTFDSQWSTVAFKVPAGHAAFNSNLSEGAGTLCAPSVTKCFGEVVNLSLPADSGTFSATNPFHLQITLIPGDFNATNTDFSNMVIVHQPDGVGAQPEVIKTKCTANPPVSDSLPCFFPTKIQGSLKLWVIDIYGVSNGGWHPGSI